MPRGGSNSAPPERARGSGLRQVDETEAPLEDPASESRGWHRLGQGLETGQSSGSPAARELEEQAEEEEDSERDQIPEEDGERRIGGRVHEIVV